MSSTGAARIDEREESHSQWTQWVKDYVARVPKGELQVNDGLLLAWSNTLLPVFNQAIIAQPVKDAGALDEMLDSAAAFAAERSLPWILTVCEDCLPDPLRGSLTSTMAGRGYELAFPFTAMATESLTAPSVPAGLTFRRVDSPDDGYIVGDLNCGAYGMPLEMGRDFFSHPIVNGKDYMYLGLAGGEPVSTATVTPVDGRLYVSFVATNPAHHRKGYAGAVMYHALQHAIRDTGIPRTVLHATDAGYKVYERMGYHPVNRLSAWVQH